MPRPKTFRLAPRECININTVLTNLLNIEEELLAMVREVSQDKLYDTVEFNEFLTMIAMQKKHEITHEDLVEAFKYVIRGEYHQ